MKKNSLAFLLLSILLLGLTFGIGSPTQGQAKIGDTKPIVPVDQAVLDQINAEGTASYWINFESEPDLSQSYTMNWSERGWFVYEQLSETAAISQADVLSTLNNAQADYQSFWINNSILVKDSSRSMLNGLLNMSGIKGISARKSYILYEPETIISGDDVIINTVESNLTHINVDDVWDLGYTGEGLVVASIDTGVRYTHEALVGQYRGNNGDGSFTHDYNWYDPNWWGYSYPRDTNGHGTHTMGIMVGDDGGSNKVGVAPDAEWIACRGCTNRGCSDNALVACAEFLAAPTNLSGGGANPDLRPNVINNSWGDCGQSYDDWYQDVVDVWHAAGIYPVFSNGNSSNCDYPTPPGLNTVGNPARYGNVTGVGASGTSNGQYATFSNWGPTDNLDTFNAADGFDMMKPQVIAPGTAIRSSFNSNDTSFALGTGTSMAAPHVAGLVALMWEAAPYLVGDYAVTEALIEESAVPMYYDDGITITSLSYPNFATGWGEIDALAAVELAIYYGDPTAIALGDLSTEVSPKLDAVDVVWQTYSEIGMKGFNVYRAESPLSPFEQVNSTLIPTLYHNIIGGPYKFTDTSVISGQTYYYWVEILPSGETIGPEGVFVGMKFFLPVLMVGN